MSTIKPISGRSTDELNAELEKHLGAGHRAAWLVVVGLLFEAVVVGLFRRDTEGACLIAADLGIAIGVYREIRSERKAKAISDELQRRSNERVADAERLSAEANQGAEEARLALAKFREPRHLSDEQIERIAGELKRFNGIEFDIGVAAGDPEFLDLALIIEKLLRVAGWRGIDFTGSAGSIELSRRIVDGPFIGMSATAEGVTIGISRPEGEIPLIAEAGLELARLLDGEGISTSCFELRPISPTNDNAVHIRIGRKP